MGFFETLEKAYDVTTDILIKAGKTKKRHIDRMTDEEIEKRYSKPAKLVRQEAATVGADAERLEMQKKMEKEMKMNKKNGVYDNDY